MYPKVSKSPQRRFINDWRKFFELGIRFTRQMLQSGLFLFAYRGTVLNLNISFRGIYLL